MDPERLYASLEQLAAKLNISIRYENLAHPGQAAHSGLCRIRGQYVYIMDSSKTIHQRISLLAECLRKMNLEGVYVVPAIRSLLDIKSDSPS